MWFPCPRSGKHSAVHVPSLPAPPVKSPTCGLPKDAGFCLFEMGTVVRCSSNFDIGMNIAETSISRKAAYFPQRVSWRLLSDSHEDMTGLFLLKLYFTTKSLWAHQICWKGYLATLSNLQLDWSGGHHIWFTFITYNLLTKSKEHWEDLEDGNHQTIWGNGLWEIMKTMVFPAIGTRLHQHI